MELEYLARILHAAASAASHDPYLRDMLRAAATEAAVCASVRDLRKDGSVTDRCTGPAVTADSYPNARIYHSEDNRYHRVVVAFGEDGGAAASFLAWFNSGRLAEPDVAVTRPLPAYPAYHEFDPNTNDGMDPHFCKECDGSKYAEQHILRAAAHGKPVTGG